MRSVTLLKSFLAATFLLFAAVLTFPSVESVRDSLVRRGGKIYFVGDSLTAGDQSYPEIIAALLRDSFPRARITVVKHAEGGARMSDLEKWASADLKGPHSDASVVFVQDAGLTDHPLAEFERALKNLIHSASGRKVVLINEGRKPGWQATPEVLKMWNLRADELVEGMSVEQWYEYWQRELNPALAFVARSAHAQLIDYRHALEFFLAAHPKAPILHPDGLHLDEGGKLFLALLCLRDLGFSREELRISAVSLDAELKGQIAQSVFRKK